MSVCKTASLYSPEAEILRGEFISPSKWNSQGLDCNCFR